MQTYDLKDVATVVCAVRNFLRKSERRRQLAIVRRRNAVKYIEHIWLTFSRRRRTLQIIREIVHLSRIRRIMKVFVSKCRRAVRKRTRRFIGAAIRLQFCVRLFLFGWPFKNQKIRTDDNAAFLQAMVRRAVLTGQHSIQSKATTPQQMLKCITRVQAFFRGFRTRQKYAPIIRARWSKRIQELDNQLLSLLRRKYYNDVGRLVPRPASVGESIALDDVVLSGGDSHDDLMSSTSLNETRAYIRPSFPARIHNPCSYCAMTRRWACRERDVDTPTLRSQFARTVVEKNWVSTLHPSGTPSHTPSSSLSYKLLKHMVSGCGSRVRTPSEITAAPSVIRTHKKKHMQIH